MPHESRSIRPVTFRRRVQIQSFAIGLVLGSVYISAIVAWRFTMIVAAVAPVAVVERALP
jgi:hypothetical protein